MPIGTIAGAAVGVGLRAWQVSHWFFCGTR